MIRIFDTHAHYNDSAYDSDRVQLFEKMYKDGVDKITLIGANIHDSEVEKNIAKKYNAIKNLPTFYYTVGDHPDEIPKYSVESIDGIEHLKKLEEICKDENNIKCVAIGEIGLDYYGEYKTQDDYESQKKWFISEIEIAKKLNLPIVIHSRDACKDTLDIISEYAKGMKGIIHCFSYEKEVAVEYLKLGFYIGIGGVVTFKNGRKLREVVESVPIEMIVTETDAPYLTPMPYRGKRNESTNIKYVVEEIAKIKNISLENAYEILYRNALSVYNLNNV